jgi:hypothetical protein
MPKTKNQAKNKSHFEVRGGVINEFEFASNEGAMTEEEHQRFTRQEEERRVGSQAADAKKAGAKKAGAKAAPKKGATKKAASRKTGRAR